LHWERSVYSSLRLFPKRSNKTKAKQQYPSKKKQIPDFRALARKAANKVAKAVGFAPPTEPPKPAPEVVYVAGRACLADDWTDYASAAGTPPLSTETRAG
jgi:hypothetical protein